MLRYVRASDLQRNGPLFRRKVGACNGLNVLLQVEVDAVTSLVGRAPGDDTGGSRPLKVVRSDDSEQVVSDVHALKT